MVVFRYRSGARMLGWAISGLTVIGRWRGVRGGGGAGGRGREPAPTMPDVIRAALFDFGGVIVDGPFEAFAAY